MLDVLKLLLKRYPDDVSLSSNDPEIREVARILKERSFSPFARSVHVRMVDCGSPNDVELEQQMMMGPRVDAERFGVHFVASPRHADVLLATGPVSMNMKLALEKTYNAMPEPKAVIAAGDGAISGTPYSGSYALFGKGTVEEVIPVDVKISGNPPSPYELLAGILKAGMIIEKKAKTQR